ncbi:MAG: peptidylprolyl isomerase, partial [Phycisphaerales bacterium]
MKSRTDARAMSLFSQSTSAPARLWRRAGRPAAQAMMETLEDRRLMAIVVNNGQALADLNIDLNSGVMVFDLTGRYNDDGITGTLVRFNTTSGTIDVELFDQAGAARTRTTPITVTNCLNYIANGRYINNVFHRSVPGFVVQGGGFSLPSQNNTAPPAIASDPAIQNEPGNNNIRGTIAMAKLGGDPNSATNQWFFNLADNRGNLDNQNGGFTAFGRIINGLSVPDAISNLRRRNFGSPFDELPVRDSYDDQTIRPADFVTTSSIAVNGDRASVVNQSLTYTVTSSNPTLVSAYLYNGRLVVAPGQNLSGSADITVTITGVDGSTTTDVFSVNVGAGQAAAQLQVAPLPIGGVGAAFTATAGGATFADVDVNTVSFYLDSNRNGAFDIETDMLLGQDGPDGGFVFSGNANGFSAGVNLIFARGALTSGGNTAVASAVAFVNASPTINSVSATPNPILTQGASITITANTVVDADGSIARVRFYLDSNGDGMLQTDTDTLLGEDTSAVGGYSISNISTTGFTLGTSLNRIFAQATDNEGAVSVAVSTTVRVNTAPVITVFNNVTALRPNVAVLSATATDDGNNITRVQFFRDSNGNGTFDPDTDTLIGEDTTATNGVYSINLATATLSLGNLAVFARALDADNTTGAIATAIVAISSAPPTVASVTRTPDPLPMVGSMLRLTATNVRDLDSTIARVEFYRGPVGLTTFDPMMVTLIGMDTSSIGGYTLEVAATDALGFAPGMYRIFAVAVDTDGVSTLAANVPSVTGRINAVPTIGSVVPTNATVARLTSATFTANNVADDAGVTRVEFYRDLNGNGTLDIGIDRLLGSDASATGGY